MGCDMYIGNPVIKQVIKEMVFDPQHPQRPVIKSEVGWIYTQEETKIGKKVDMQYRYITFWPDWELNSDFEHLFSEISGKYEHISGKYDYATRTFEFGDSDYKDGKHVWTRYDKVWFAGEEIRNLPEVEKEIARRLTEQAERFMKAVRDAMEWLNGLGVPASYIIARDRIVGLFESSSGEIPLSLYGLKMHGKFVCAQGCPCGVYTEDHYGRFVAFADQTDMSGIPEEK